jgi:hypothetical protein
VTLQETFLTEVYQHLGLCGTWPPSFQLELGDIVELRRSSFSRVANIKELDLAFIGRTQRTNATYHFVSAGAVSMTLKATGTLLAGSNLGKDDAGVHIQFGRENAVIFQATNCSIMDIANKGALGAAVLKLYSRNEWNSAHTVVTGVIKAERTTVVLSNASDAHIDLRLHAGAAAGEIGSIIASGNCEIASSRSIGLQVIAERNQTPLFRPAAIVRPLLGLGSPAFRERGNATAKSAAFQDCNIDWILSTLAHADE